MSWQMQESTVQGYMKNFNQAITASVTNTMYDTPVFLGNDFDVWHDHELQLHECMGHPILFRDKMIGDIMYLYQALQQQDAVEFVTTVVKEVNRHVVWKHRQLIECNKVPKDTEPLPALWAMRKKRDLTTNAITKYKARANINGGKQEYRVNYYKTYAPMVTWFAICLVIVVAILFGWAPCQVDFVPASMQAPLSWYVHGTTTRDRNKYRKKQNSCTPVK